MIIIRTPGLCNQDSVLPRGTIKAPHCASYIRRVIRESPSGVRLFIFQSTVNSNQVPRPGFITEFNVMDNTL